MWLRGHRVQATNPAERGRSIRIRKVHPRGERRGRSEKSRTHIQFMTASSMVGTDPKWADQLNSSNEATNATPQTVTM